MANSSRNQPPTVVTHTPAETSNSEATMHTQQALIEQARVTDEQDVVSVDSDLDETSTNGINDEKAEGTGQDNEVESTRENQIETADQVANVYQSSLSSGPSLGTNTRLLPTERTGDVQIEGSVFPSPSLSTTPTHRRTEPVMDVLSWMDHVIYRRTHGVTSPSWQHGYRAGVRETINAFSEYGLITVDMDLDLLPEPLFSNPSPDLRRGSRTESVGGHVDVISRKTSQEHRATSDTGSELDTNAAETSAAASPTRVTYPSIVSTTTPGRPRATSILSAGGPSGSALATPTASTSTPLSLRHGTHTEEPSDQSPRVFNATSAHEVPLNTWFTTRGRNQHVRYPSAPLLATNENLYARPSRSSMMEYAKATEDVNDMKRFDDEGGEDEVVPGGLVRGSPVGGYPKRRSSVLRRVNIGRRERESALYSSGLNQAVEEENRERMTEMMEDLGTGAERSGGGNVRKLLEKGKKRVSRLFN